MQSATDFVPYFGPRPAPARRWAPWVIATSAALALGNFALLVLNLMERSLQQRRTSTKPPSPKQVHDTLTRIRTVGQLVIVVSIAFLVVTIGWEVRRRSRSRVARHGETGVEARLRTVWRSGYAFFCGLLGTSILLTFLATEVHDSARTPDDFVRYRSYLVAAHLVRAVMWCCLIVLVDRATQFQARREAATDPTAFPQSHF